MSHSVGFKACSFAVRGADPVGVESGGGFEPPESTEGVVEDRGPSPVLLQPENEATTSADDMGRGVEKAVTQGLGGPLLRLAAQTQILEEGDQVLSSEHQLEPHAVGHEIVKGKVLLVERRFIKLKRRQHRGLGELG